jgi:hypothetical protein
MIDATRPAPAPAVIEWRFGGMFSARRRVWRVVAILSFREGPDEPAGEEGEPVGGAPAGEGEVVEDEASAFMEEEA